MNIFEQPAMIQDYDFVEKQKEFAKYGIKYENSGNFFVPALDITISGIRYFGHWYLEEDCNRFPKMREAIRDIDACIISDKFFDIKKHFKARKAEKYLNKLAKEFGVKCYSSKEKSEYIQNYETQKQNELKLAKAKENEQVL